MAEQNNERRAVSGCDWAGSVVGIRQFFISPGHQHQPQRPSAFSGWLYQAQVGACSCCTVLAPPRDWNRRSVLADTLVEVAGHVRSAVVYLPTVLQVAGELHPPGWSPAPSERATFEYIPNAGFVSNKPFRSFVCLPRPGAPPRSPSHAVHGDSIFLSTYKALPGGAMSQRAPAFDVRQTTSDKGRQSTDLAHAQFPRDTDGR